MSSELGHGSGRIPRRAALKAFVGIGLATGLADCVPAPEPGAAPAPAGSTPAAREPSPEALRPQPGPPEEHDHPAAGDLFVFALGARAGEVLTPEAVPLGGPQILAFPMDADGSHVASESRLEQVILVRMDPSELTDETRARSADGIVAYSGVCTHTGCDVTDWDERTHYLVCPCHDSEFDPSDNARVVFGPAPRRLAALPVAVVDGALRIAGPFSGRVGFQRG